MVKFQRSCIALLTSSIIKLTWHYEVDDSPVIPGKAQGPTQEWLIQVSHQVTPAAPCQVLHSFLLLIVDDTLPVSRKDVF